MELHSSGDTPSETGFAVQYGAYRGRKMVRWHRSLIYGYRNSLDLQEIERDDGSYDIVICNHVLEHVKKKRQAFREILRILRPTGFLQFSVPNPKLHAETKDWGYPKPDMHEHYRVYGRDLLLRFSEAQGGAHILEVDATDEVTGVSDFVYFASLDESWIDAMQV